MDKKIVMKQTVTEYLENSFYSYAESRGIDNDKWLIDEQDLDKLFEKAKEIEADKKYSKTDLFRILLDFIEFPHPYEEPRGSIIERFLKTLE